jgi:hypothetical protein
MMNAAAGIRPVRLVLWGAVLAIAQALILAPLAAPSNAREAWLFGLYVAGSSALAVWAASLLPELAANARTAVGRRIVYAAGVVAMAAALVAGAYFAGHYGYHPFWLIFAACMIVLASAPFFALLLLTLVGEWYFRLPRRPR